MQYATAKEMVLSMLLKFAKHSPREQQRCLYLESVLALLGFTDHKVKKRWRDTARLPSLKNPSEKYSSEDIAQGTELVKKFLIATATETPYTWVRMHYLECLLEVLGFPGYKVKPR